MDMMALDSFQLELGRSSEIGMAIVLAIMMFAVALGLRTEHFAFLKQQPRVYFAGVFAQIIGLPLLTLGLCFVFTPPPSVALGMILIACCPGGNTSNLLSLYARANTALSVSLTATSSLAAAFITPISIIFWCSLYPPTRNLLTEIDFGIISFLLQTLVILALPLLCGMTLAINTPKLAQTIQKPLAIISGVGLSLIIIIACIKYIPIVLTIGFGLIGLVILHNGLGFLMGNIASRLAGGGEGERRALTIEVGIQNSGLGIVILLTQLNGLGGAGAVAGIWGTWHLIAGTALVLWYRSKDKREQYV